MSNDVLLTTIGTIAGVLIAWLKFKQTDQHDSAELTSKAYNMLAERLDRAEENAEKSSKNYEKSLSMINELNMTILNLKTEMSKKDLENAQEMLKIQTKLDEALALLRANNIPFKEEII